MYLGKLPSLLRSVAPPLSTTPLSPLHSVAELGVAIDNFIIGTAKETPLTPDLKEVTVGGAIQGPFCLLPKYTLEYLNQITTAGNMLATQLRKSGQNPESVQSTLSKLSDGMIEGLPIRGTQPFGQGDVVTQAENMASLVQTNKALQQTGLNPDSIEPLRNATIQLIEKQHVPLLEAEGRKAVQETIGNLNAYTKEDIPVDLTNAHFPKTPKGGLDMGETPLTIVDQTVDLAPLRHTPSGASIFEGGNLPSTVIDRSQVTNFNASNSNLSGTLITSSTVNNGDFSKADLPNTELIRSKLTGNFEGANMQRLKLNDRANVEGTAHSVNLEKVFIGRNSSLSLQHPGSGIPENSSVTLAGLTQDPTSEVIIPHLAGSHNLFLVDPSQGTNNFDQIRWNLPDNH